MVSSPSLLEMLDETLALNQVQLPIFAPWAQHVHTRLSTEGSGVNQLASLVMEDPALTCHILQAANSGFYTGLRQTATVREAIVRLGAKKTVQLIMAATQQQTYRADSKILGVYIETLWKHARGCALGTKWLAEKLGYEHLAQEAFLAGLLHDIGKLFLLRVFEDIHTTGAHEVSLSRAVIVEVMEHMHAEQGAKLLQQWNLPEMYGDIARKHHAEAFDTTNELLTMVRLVNLTCRKVGTGLQHDPTIVLAATPEAQSLEVTDIVLAELEIMLEDIPALVTS